MELKSSKAKDALTLINNLGHLIAKIYTDYEGVLPDNSISDLLLSHYLPVNISESGDKIEYHFIRYKNGKIYKRESLFIPYEYLDLYAEMKDPATFFVFEQKILDLLN